MTPDPVSDGPPRGAYSENASATSSELEECYACEEPIQDGDWVIPLTTYRAASHGDDLVLNADETLETVIHARCLKTGESADYDEHELSRVLELALGHADERPRLGGRSDEVR